MSQSIFAAFLGSFSAVAANLMHIQERAAAQCAGGIDPRDLPEYLQRDIGMTDGRLFGEEVPSARDLSGHAAVRWTDHIQTRQAA